MKVSNDDLKKVAKELNEITNADPPVDLFSDDLKTEIEEVATLLEDSDCISKSSFDILESLEIDLPAKIKIKKDKPAEKPSVKEPTAKKEPAKYAEAKNRKVQASVKEKAVAEKKPEKKIETKDIQPKAKAKVIGKSKYGAQLGSAHALLDDLFITGMKRTKIVEHLVKEFPDRYASKDGDKKANQMINQHIKDLLTGARTGGKSVKAKEDDKGFISI